MSRVPCRQTNVRCGPDFSVTGRTKRLRRVESEPRYFPSVSLTRLPSVTEARSKAENCSRAEDLDIVARVQPERRSRAPSHRRFGLAIAFANVPARRLFALRSWRG